MDGELGTVSIDPHDSLQNPRDYARLAEWLNWRKRGWQAATYDHPAILE